MSGIAALLRLDGSSAQEADLSEILRQMHRRGPEGEGRLADGPVALGHRLLATTPEAVTEPMPLRDARTGCCITADVRLDNREALFTAFGLTGSERKIGDGALILRAWEKWGEDCPTQLLGDFAFLIWDPRRQQLFGARDQMGMKQLIYAHRPGKRLVCASSANAVVAAPCIETRLNELRVAESLVYHEDGSLISTFFEDVFRLPPGHLLSARGDRFETRRYWQQDPVEPLRLKSNEAYAEAFQEVFRTAIRARLRSAGGVASMLSGGIDSGATSAIAADEMARMGAGPLPTLSVVGPDPESCYETRMVHISLAMDNISPTLIDHSDPRELTEALIDFWKSIEEPWDGTMTLQAAIYTAARNSGSKVVLDGVAGDVVLSESDMMARLVRQGRIGKLWQEAKGVERHYAPSHNVPAWKETRNAVRSGLAPVWFRELRKTYFRRIGPTPLQSEWLINADYAKRVGLIDSLLAYRTAPVSRRMGFPEKRVQSVTSPALTVGRERYDRVAASQGVEPRDAFMDQRVAEFCLSLPMEQLQNDGWPKVILRRAVNGYLPKEAAWRRGRWHHASSLRQTIVNDWKEWESLVDDVPRILQQRVDFRSAGVRVQAFKTDRKLDSSLLDILSTALFVNKTMETLMAHVVPSRR